MCKNMWVSRIEHTSSSNNDDDDDEEEEESDSSTWDTESPSISSIDESFCRKHNLISPKQQKNAILPQQQTTVTATATPLTGIEASKQFCSIRVRQRKAPRRSKSEDSAVTSTMSGKSSRRSSLPTTTTTASSTIERAARMDTIKKALEELAALDDEEEEETAPQESAAWTWNLSEDKTTIRSSLAKTSVRRSKSNESLGGMMNHHHHLRQRPLKPVTSTSSLRKKSNLPLRRSKTQLSDTNVGSTATPALRRGTGKHSSQDLLSRATSVAAKHKSKNKGNLTANEVFSNVDETTTKPTMVVKPQTISREALLQTELGESSLTFPNELEWNSWKEPEPMENKPMKKNPPNLDTLGIGEHDTGRKDSASRSRTSRSSNKSKSEEGKPETPKKKKNHHHRSNSESLGTGEEEDTASRGRASRSSKHSSKARSRTRSASRSVQPKGSPRKQLKKKKDELHISMHGTSGAKNLSEEERLMIIKGNASMSSHKASKERRKRRDEMSQTTHGTSVSNQHGETFKRKSKASQEGLPLMPAGKSNDFYLSEELTKTTEDLSESTEQLSSSFDMFGSFNDSAVFSDETGPKKERRKKKKGEGKHRSRSAGDRGSKIATSREQASLSEHDSATAGDSRNASEKTSGSEPKTATDLVVSQKANESGKKKKKGRRTGHSRVRNEKEEGPFKEFPLGFGSEVSNEDQFPKAPKFGAKTEGKRESIESKTEFFDAAQATWIGDSSSTPVSKAKKTFKKKDASQSERRQSTTGAVNESRVVESTERGKKKNATSKNTGSDVSHKEEASRSKDARKKTRRRSKTPTSEIASPATIKGSVERRRRLKSTAKPKTAEVPITPQLSKETTEETPGYELKLFESEDVSPLTVFSKTPTRRKRWAGLESRGDLKIDENFS